MEHDKTLLPDGSPAIFDDPVFDRLVAASQTHFNRILAERGDTLFTVAAGDLSSLFLSHLPPEQLRYHTCACCRLFLQRFGSLVSIKADGGVKSALWNAGEAPDPYKAAVAAMAEAVKAGAVTGVFFSTAKIWGKPKAGGFPHFCLTVPDAPAVRSTLATAGSRRAAKRENFRTLTHGLATYPQSVVARALTVLEAEALYRSETVIGPARWLLRLHQAIAGKPEPLRNRLIWHAVARAPVGFCTPRSSMIGTLLDDLAADLAFKDVKARFEAKMHPLLYQRPQAPPKAGNVADAERLIAELGLESALHRRFARLEEIQTLWKPARSAKKAMDTGVFSHLPRRGKDAQPLPEMPAEPITWAKFARKVLPQAKRMAVFMEPNMDFCGMLTALHANAPPILQWDHPEQRNPFSLYVYQGGSSPERWGLRAGDWVAVTGAALSPHMWGGEDRFSNRGKRVLFVLDGAHDTDIRALCLFPECLRHELHRVRATIEAYSQSRPAVGAQEGTANGLMLGNGANAKARIAVTSDIGTACYSIDRWD